MIEWFSLPWGDGTHEYLPLLSNFLNNTHIAAGWKFRHSYPNLEWRSMWLSPAIAGIVGARRGPLFEPRRGLHFIPRASGIDCCEMFTAGRVSSTPRPFIGRWTLVWQAGVCLRQIVDHRGCSQAVANGQSHGFTFPSASQTRWLSCLQVLIIK